VAGVLEPSTARTNAEIEEASEISSRVIAAHNVDYLDEGLKAAVKWMSQYSLSGNGRAVYANVLRNESELLLNSLGQIQNKALSLALALPDAEETGIAAPFFAELVRAMKKHEDIVKELIHDGQIPAEVHQQLRTLGTSNVRRTNLKQSVIPINSQSGVPLVVVRELLGISANPMFYPIQGTGQRYDDPLFTDYMNLLKVVTALHLADLLASGDPVLTQDTEKLKEELLRRLNLFEGPLAGIIMVNQSANGFLISGLLAKAYLIQKAMSTVARAA